MAKIPAKRVSKDKKGTIISPADGYEQTMEIELSDWQNIGPLNGVLPPPSQNFPQDAPFPDLCVVGGDVYEKKKP
ncbi:hypothetical protein [Rugamonas aquatica]|uniref:Uncharacterized protein n=1 Tax=Rugamonas aquatica TaxID=2743357 RepID=A0A6A7NAJ5_9BURK|nr:hypothetical protein [Rugamonas aquatica]MQA42150.1 hypothetical protein [Rugamonas aquatica]